MRLKIIITILIFFLSVEAFSQNFLVMDKIGGRQRVEFRPGDTLEFRMTGEDHFNTAAITHLQDSLIILDIGVIELEDVAAIRLNGRRQGLLAYHPLVRVAGVGYIFIDQFNHVVIGGQEPAFHRRVWRTGGILVALSYVMKFSRRTTFPIRGNRRLRIVDFSTP